jgi:hypothetical protein
MAVGETWLKKMLWNRTRNDSWGEARFRRPKCGLDNRTLVFPENADDAALNFDVIRGYHDGRHL